MVVLLDGSAHIEFKRTQALTEQQRDYLDRMDVEMDAGIQLEGQFIADPDQTQRIRYVALGLLQSILADHEQRIAATCSYLANRLPELKQVRITTRTDQTAEIELIFDKPYRDEVKVNFSPELKLH